MSVMAVLMSALLPVWSHMATREKEEELHLPRQAVRARDRPVSAQVREHRAADDRSCWSNNDFSGRNTKTRSPTTTSSRSMPTRRHSTARRRSDGAAAWPECDAARGTQRSSNRCKPVSAAPGVGAQGGVIGVTSKSKDASIKIYNGRTHYNEWAFVYIQTAQRPGLPVCRCRASRAGRPGKASQRHRGRQVPLACSRATRLADAATFRNRRRDSVTPNRPPIGAPNSPFGNPNQNPNGQFTTPNGSTTFTPAPGARRPGGGQ